VKYVVHHLIHYRNLSSIIDKSIRNNSTQKGTIKETWKQVEPDNWFNPAFQNFVNTEIVRATSQKNAD